MQPDYLLGCDSLQIAQINMEHIGACLVCGLREDTRCVIKLRCIVIELENKVVRYLATKFKFFSTQSEIPGQSV